MKQACKRQHAESAAGGGGRHLQLGCALGSSLGSLRLHRILVIRTIERSCRGGLGSRLRALSQRKTLKRHGCRLDTMYAQLERQITKDQLQ